ncbi:MAG: Gldg family protein [Pseudomonadota bacterium]
MSREATARIRRKELRLLFASPAAWLFLSAFAGGSLFLVFWVESFFARNIADLRPLFEWLPLLLIPLCASLTMRMWSEEHRDGTLEHVLTQSIGLWPFIYGKFQACIVMLLLALATSAPLAITLAVIGDMDWGPALAGYLAALLLGASYASIGLWVSAHTRSPIVALIGSSLLCGTLYLVGTPLVTGFFDNDTAAWLAYLGSGARFESIARGVLDLRDLAYYLSLCALFLLLTQLALQRSRWAGHGFNTHHRQAWIWASLLILNLLAANYWLQYLHGWRLDVTREQRFSISDSSMEIISQLEEPLLIRGYFSERTHPRLAPLVPQLKDLLEELELRSDGRIRLEWLDPATDPAAEDEANRLYEITATPVQIADRHQSSIVNAYFNLLVQYGDEFQTLGFNDLIEVKVTPHTAPEILLRNPEFDVTRAIKNALYNYRRGSRVFDSITSPVEFIAYVSDEQRLPVELRSYLTSIKALLQEVEREAQGKFSTRFIKPEAGDGRVAAQIAQEWGFQPLTAAVDDNQAFYFYLTLADDQQVVQLSTDDFDAAQFRTSLQAGLRRFARNMTRTVALHVPPSQPGLVGGIRGPTFQRLEQELARDYNLLREDLSDGSVYADADTLLVLAPDGLRDIEVYAIDQFLMRGGTVLLSTSPFHANLADGELSLRDHNSGLKDWLNHHGVVIEPALVLDENNGLFLKPVTRRQGAFEFQDVSIVNYPYFIDLRGRGLSGEHPATAGVYQATMAWASPVSTQRVEGRRTNILLRSGPRSWTSDSRDILEPPDLDEVRGSVDLGPRNLAVQLQGRMTSYFPERPLSDLRPEQGFAQFPHPTLLRSPESARLVVFGSNDFLRDQVLNIELAASGNPYIGAMELMLKSVDWAVDDSPLREIRSRDGMRQTLPPMDRGQQRALEYFNYAAALVFVALLLLMQWLLDRFRRLQLRRSLNL